MRRWRVLVAGACSLLVLTGVWYRAAVAPAEAQFVRTDCNAIASANVANGQTCSDSTFKVIRQWNGTTWASVTNYNGTNFVVPTSGPHSIGPENPFQQSIPIPDGNTMLWVTGDFTPSHAGDVEGLSVSPALRPNAGASAFGLEVRPSIVMQASGTHPLITAISIEHDIQGTANAVTNLTGINIDTITATPGTVNASAIRVVSTPTGATNNFGLNIGGVGRNRIDGSLTLTDGATGVVGPSLFSNNSLLNSAGGTLGYRWFDNQTTNQRMRLTETGTLIVGTGTTTQGAGVLDVASLTLMNSVPAAVASATGNNLVSVRGISATQTIANNLRGTCTFAAASTCAVAFARNEPDASYFIALGPAAAAAANVMPYGVTSKAVSGFTITATVSNSNAVDWILIH